MNEEEKNIENKLAENHFITNDVASQNTKEEDKVSDISSDAVQTAEFEVKDASAKPGVCTRIKEEKSSGKCVSPDTLAICIALVCALISIIMMSIVVMQSKKPTEYHLTLTIDQNQKDALINALTDKEKEEIIEQDNERIAPVPNQEQGLSQSEQPFIGRIQGTKSNRAYIGIACMRIPDEYIESGYPQGVFVLSVDEGSGAEFAGIQPYDIITAVEEQAITSPTELVAAIENFQPGDMVTVKVIRIRNGRAINKDVKVVLGSAQTN